jgi:hypothetical protein
LAPFRNIDARFVTAPDIDLAGAFGVTDLLLPVLARFIAYPLGGKYRLAYANIKIPFIRDLRNLFSCRRESVAPTMMGYCDHFDRVGRDAVGSFASRDAR